MNLFDKLPKILSFGKKEEIVEYFFGLSVTQNSVTGCVWGIENNRLKIINSAESTYESEADLIEASNFVLDQALGEFNPEPTKILFGVPEDWLQDDDLKPEYLKTLKQLVKELDVTPMAYVATNHSITHLLQKQTGAPVTAVLVQVSDPLVVSVVKAGKIIGSKSLKRSENLPKDIEKALQTFTEVEVLPSRILIFGSGNMAKFKEELLAYSWMSQLPFLHLPKIEELDRQIVIQSISFAGASEINPDINLHKHDLEFHKPQRSNVKPLEGQSAHHKGKKEVNDAGFVAGDIESSDKKSGEEMMDSNVRDIDVYGNEVSSRGAERPVSANSRALSAGLSIPSGIVQTGIGVFLKIGIIPLLLIAILAAFLLLQKAKVTVFVDLKTLEREATVTADPNVGVVDEGNKVIPGKIVETEVTTTGKGSASGKKQVGDPAKGTVIVYNKTSAPRSFNAGTILIGSNNSKFTLDSSVNVASQSAVEGGISFGKGTVNVTASAIGPDGNLPAGKELNIDGQDAANFSAKVDTAFSGGVAKDVMMVTADDQKKLLAEVLSGARKQAKEELQGKMTDDYKILEEALSERIIKQTYSKNVGDQATDFNLNLTVNLKGTSYKDGDLKSIVSKLVETNVPEGYDLDLTKTETQADVSRLDKDGKLMFTAKFRAKLMPKLDPEKLKKEITFKSVEDASARLKQIENVIGSNIDIKPNLPGPLSRLPVLSNNITIEITAK